MGHEEYQKKRDLEKTDETKGYKKLKGGNIYVIQKHQARHLHYDLRLEMDGVLKSWAIPKTPPTEKGLKRLAVQVEDHPIDYSNFEGCFEFYTKIMTDRGSLNIGKIVNRKLRVKALSYNSITDRLEWKRIVGWFKNGRTKDFIRIRVPGQHGGRRIITVTPNHMIYTPEGLKPAEDLRVGDDVLVPGVRWSNEQMQILLGTILGDAHLEQSTETRVPHYELTHAGRQKGYLEFIRNQLAPEARIRRRTNSDSYSFRFTDVSLVNLHGLLYNERKKIVTKEVLFMLDERGLAVWYMDDGYLAQNKYTEFMTQGFTKEENDLIADFLNAEWQLEAKVYHTKPRKKSAGGYFIHLSRVGSMRFLTLVNNFILKELRYKTYIRRYRSEWKSKRGIQNVVPARIVAVEKAESKHIRSQQRYDIHVQDNSNFFAGSMLVSNSIPEGQYGAGTVEIWDKGEYILKEKGEDKLVFEIRGNKLKGNYCLVRFKGKKNWLFFKKK